MLSKFLDIEIFLKYIGNIEYYNKTSAKPVSAIVKSAAGHGLNKY